MIIVINVSKINHHVLRNGTSVRRPRRTRFTDGNFGARPQPSTGVCILFLATAASVLVLEGRRILHGTTDCIVQRRYWVF